MSEKCLVYGFYYKPDQTPKYESWMRGYGYKVYIFQQHKYKKIELLKSSKYHDKIIYSVTRKNLFKSNLDDLLPKTNQRQEKGKCSGKIIFHSHLVAH